MKTRGQQEALQKVGGTETGSSRSRDMHVILKLSSRDNGDGILIEWLT
jgi:hypothetical protein